MTLLLALAAPALCLAAAALVYLASPQQQLRADRLPAIARAIAVPCAAAGIASWCAAIGWGAGIAAAMTAIMLAWVALPYFAWWLRGAPRKDARR